METTSAAMSGEPTSVQTSVWKQLPKADDAENPVRRIPLAQARQFFAVDASGSTAGNIIVSEQAFVQNVHHENYEDKVATWGSTCGRPEDSVASLARTWHGDKGGTSPEEIFTYPDTLDTIIQSDVWYLLTDGEVGSYGVQRLCTVATEKNVLNVPVIFVITGSMRDSPNQLDVSVGITFFANAQDVLCLFRDLGTGTIYVLASKGCFAALTDANGNSTPDLSSWKDLRMFLNEEDFLANCHKNGVKIPTADTRPKLPSGIPLGEEWEKANGMGVVVDLDALLSAGMLSNEEIEQLLAEDAFNNLAVACKTRGRAGDLRSFILLQKIGEIAVKLEDAAGANAIIARLGETNLDKQARDQLQAQLREAHATNRRAYQNALKNMLESSEAQAVRTRNRMVDRALQQLAEVESTSYTADILSRRSNRARRAANVVPTDSDIAMTVLNLETPTAFRGQCFICCGDNEVMSIALENGADGAFNTDNFALDFPLAAGRLETNRNIISSQCICFQCALLGCPGESIYRESIAAVLPTLEYTGSNKRYINEQLYLALTGGLKTGASGAAQLFMTMLDRTLKTKLWAGATTDPEFVVDSEISQRRDMFQWVLANMLRNTSCRETFNEQGPWVSYPKALAWAAQEFRSEGLDSFAVRYPAAGFMQLLTFGEMTGSFDQEIIRDLRASKILHSVTSAFLALLLRDSMEGLDAAWKQPLLAMIYSEFNADLVPIDFGGSRSLLTSTDRFWRELSAFLKADSELLADWSAEEQERVMRRVQLLVFWLVYFQKGHTSAKTFFAKLRQEQPLAASVLDVRAALPPSLADPVLLSIFHTHNDPNPTDIAAPHDGTAPFATPFGPSVLHCSHCHTPFLPSLDSTTPWTPHTLDLLRQGRAAHLLAVFGGSAQTGLPEPTLSPRPPSSRHCNLHVSVARVWKRLAVPERRLVIGDAAAAAGKGKRDGDGDTDKDADAEQQAGARARFVAGVVQEICAGRRGDVFQRDLAGQVDALLPSFFAVLELAVRMRDGLGDGEWVVDATAFEHDFAENRIAEKVEWELRAREFKRRSG